VRLSGVRRCSDLLKAAVRDGARAVAQRTDELVAADPDQRVKGPQMLLNRGGDVAQQRVAGGMTVAVVDLLSPSTSM
jgi:hypothetical protein